MELTTTLVLLVAFSVAMFLEERIARVIAGGAAIVLAVLLVVPGVQ